MVVAFSAMPIATTITDRTVPSFADHLATVRDFLLEESFRALKDEIEHLSTVDRSYIPTHKKGGTIPYEYLRSHAPLAVDLYHSPEYQAFLSRIVGDRVLPTPLHHPSSLSVLVYEKPGDYIGWHYDHNFYKGRFFTVLLGIENRGHGEDGLSSVRLIVRKPDGDIIIPTPPNMLVVFEGAKVLHRATQLSEGERRIILSMTYSTDPRYSLVREGMRRVKDVAFVGVKALWM